MGNEQIVELTAADSELNNHNNKTNHTYFVAAQIKE